MKKYIPLNYLILIVAVLITISSLSSFASLSSEINALLKKQSPAKTEWGILFEEKNSDNELFSLNPNQRMIPASNMKIVSGAAALLGLGPDFRYETTVYHTGTHLDDKINGHLIVVGNGDPSIGGRFNGGDITGLFKTWAAELKQKNIKVITGNLVGVDHAFDEERHGLNWNPLDYVEWYAAEISGLTLNDSCIDLIYNAGSKAGQKATIQVDPPTSYMNIINQVTSVSDRKLERGIEYIREPGSRDLTIRGAMPLKFKMRSYTSVPNPTLFFLTVLKETFEKEGIQIQGEIQSAKREDFPLKNEKWIELAKHQSPPFIELLKVCMHNSQNLYSEHFLKTLGFRGYGRGSLKTGVLVLKDIYAMNGCKVIDDQFIADGSGLSRDNQISAKALVEILRSVQQSNMAEHFLKTLPQAGISGTLKQRMKDNAAYQQVYAKTGTLTGVRALSGYLKAASGKEYIFSILVNGTTSGSQFNPIIDDICALVVEQG